MQSLGRPRLTDIAVALAIFLLACGLTLRKSAEISPVLFSGYAGDVWFQADADRTLANFTDRHSDHYRTQVHPISSLLLYTYVGALGKVWRGTPIDRVRHALAVLSGLWGAGLFVLLRLMSLRRFPAIAFSVLGISGAAFLFWFTVPETYGPGSLTILAVLLGAAVASRTGRLSTRALLGLNVLSLSITITNWMAGLALLIRSRTWKQSIKVALATIAIVLALALVQKHYFPSSRIFLWGAGGEGEYVDRKDAGSPIDKVRVLLIDSLVAPTIQIRPKLAPFHDEMSMQRSPAGTASPWGLAVVLAWIALLVAGLMALVVALRKRSMFAAVLGLTLAGQVALHLVYGQETFLYVLNIFPCLIALAAMSTRLRYATAIASFALVTAAGVFANNQRAWSFGTAQVAAGANERDRALLARAAHPNLPWPRASGHVPIGLPGSPLSAKAYHEPGGSFSPAPGSFGAALWITSADGTIVTSSETLKLQSIEQSYSGTGSQFSAGVSTVTPYFKVTWSAQQDATSAEINTVTLPSDGAIWVVLRSVGPAGAAVRQVTASGSAATINGEWRIQIDGVSGWVAGDESRAGITLGSPAANATAGSPQGWAYLAARLSAADTHAVRISRTASPADPPSWTPSPLWQPTVADHHFAEAARAEQTQLLMGLTDRGTRPGEPLNYTAEWARDGSIIVATLAHAGQIEIARALSAKLAKDDFFGGFGAEADAPALELWALGEVSKATGDRAFDTALLPDIRRKVALLERCLRGTEPLLVNTVVARSFEPDDVRPCERARSGLVVGRMDGHFPILFVNAVTYAGLQSAAEIAERAGDATLAKHAADLAADLPGRWLRLFDSKRRLRAQQILSEYSARPARAWAAFAGGHYARLRETTLDDNWLHANTDDRTFISGLWPTWIAGQSDEARTSFASRLQERWTEHRFNPAEVRRHSWTYFDFAEAHQWLYLGHADHAQRVLEAYFADDLSPGLYAWWEGKSEENSGDQWARLRGWLEPRGVSPHYWTAAEALSLQMDFFSYVDKGLRDRPLIVGAGIPAEWVAHPLDSGWIGTAYGRVRWSLSDGTVTLHCECKVVPRIELHGALRTFTLKADAASNEH